MPAPRSTRCHREAGVTTSRCCTRRTRSGTCRTSPSAPDSPHRSRGRAARPRSGRSPSPWASARTRSTSCTDGRCERASRNEPSGRSRPSRSRPRPPLASTRAQYGPGGSRRSSPSAPSSSSRTTSSCSAVRSIRPSGLRLRGVRCRRSPRTSSKRRRFAPRPSRRRCMPPCCPTLSASSPHRRGSRAGRTARFVRSWRRRFARSLPRPWRSARRCSFCICSAYDERRGQGRRLPHRLRRVPRSCGGRDRSLGPRACLAAVDLGRRERLRRGLLHGRRIDAAIRQAEQRLVAVVARDAEDRAAELERVLARARAESISLIVEEERRIVDSRRAAIAEREQASGRELSDALAETQRRVEQRLAEWSEDLERAQANLFEQMQRLAGRQRRLIEEAEERLAAGAEGLEAESEQQRAALMKLREEVERAAEQAITTARAELEAHTVERRRALNELTERLRRRESELRGAIEREQSDALQAIQGAFKDVEQRLVERLERVVERTSRQHADAAAAEFADAIKRSREDSAQRLSRELERAVESFAHGAEGLMSQRLENVGQAATQRLDRRLAEADALLATRRDEVVAALEQRLAGAERELRQRLEELAADGEAERGVLEARLFELQRRVDAALAHAQTLES